MAAEDVAVVDTPGGWNSTGLTGWKGQCMRVREGTSQISDALELEGVVNLFLYLPEKSK